MSKKEIAKLKQRITELEKENLLLKEQNKILRYRLEHKDEGVVVRELRDGEVVAEKESKPYFDNVPYGFSITWKDIYAIAIKRIDGKVKSVYIGKDPTEEIVKAKIEAWLAKHYPQLLGIDV